MSTAAPKVGLFRWLIAPAALGLVAGVFLVLMYLGLVTWAQDYSHARELLWDDRFFVGAIASGFGLQAALFAHVWLAVRRGLSRTSVAATTGGTGTSTVAMIACCAHHVTDALPLLGLSGVAIFLNDYRLPFMVVGLVMNGVGVVIMLRIVLRENRRLRQVTLATAPAAYVAEVES